MSGSLSFSLQGGASSAATSHPFRVMSDLASLRTNGTSCSAAIRMDDVFMGSETPALREWLHQRARIDQGFLERVFACDAVAMSSVATVAAASRAGVLPALFRPDLATSIEEALGLNQLEELPTSGCEACALPLPVTTLPLNQSPPPLAFEVDPKGSIADVTATATAATAAIDDSVIPRPLPAPDLDIEDFEGPRMLLAASLMLLLLGLTIGVSPEAM